ncbi:GntR family transcriptional regulator [Streptomyces sp. NPDC005917]|uniref:GntR family transcriptional regulator n=1 Tax=unclassified Streptomyces TaxID=2593676 RepID=UPI00340917F2
MAQSTRAYTELRSLIVRWDLPPGSPLNEVQLAERLGVSRTPLRQAIQCLAHEGLVRLTPGRGAQVSEITLQDVVSLFQMREALETHAARLCARRPDRPRFAELQAAFEAQRTRFEAGEPENGDYGSYYALIAQLDEAIDAGAMNPYLLSSLAGLRGHLERLRQIARWRHARMLQSAAEHQAICAAIQEGNESLAAQAAAVHINNSLRNILAVLAEDVGAVKPQAS